MNRDTLIAWTLITAILIGGIWVISRDPWDDPDYHIGHSHGYDEGYQEGYNEGSREGWDEGYYSGSNTGWEEGYNLGYEDGYAAALEYLQKQK